MLLQLEKVLAVGTAPGRTLIEERGEKKRGRGGGKDVSEIILIILLNENIVAINFCFRI
jgi:hypothetical protein